MSAPGDAGDRMLYLCRHGDTAWSAQRRLAGRSDIPLVEAGERNARQLGERLRGVDFDRVLTSPLLRARRTAELAGFPHADVDVRLVELDFGRFDGRTVDEVREEQKDWVYLRDPCPGGEWGPDIARRVDALLADVAEARGHVALFAHSVVLRVVAARYLGLPADAGRLLMLSPGALSVLGYDRVDASKVIATWNDRQHLTGQEGFA